MLMIIRNRKGVSTLSRKTQPQLYELLLLSAFERQRRNSFLKLRRRYRTKFWGGIARTELVRVKRRARKAAALYLLARNRRRRLFAFYAASLSQ
jgi:hypothetical protein